MSQGYAGDLRAFGNGEAREGRIMGTNGQEKRRATTIAGIILYSVVSA